MSENSCDLIRKIIIALSLEYALFFGVESILPGIVVGVVDINLLFILIFLLLGLASWKGRCLKFSQSPKEKKYKIFSYVTGGMILFFMLVMIVVWHRLDFFLIGGYLLASWLAIKLLWKNI